MFQQTYWINRDLDFSIYLANADGTAYNPGSAQYRLRVFGTPGAAIVDLAWGAGIALGDAPTGRLDVTAGSLILAAEYLNGSAELVRTDTSADVVAVWPVNIVKEGSVPFSGTTGVTINMATQNVAVTTLSGFGGPKGDTGAAGPSSLVSGMAPLFFNGDFFWWDLGTGPFNATQVIAPGIRFFKAGSSTHAISQVAGFSTNTFGYALQWNRTVAGAASSFLKLYMEDLRLFHGKTITIVFEVLGDAAIDFNSRLVLNYGTGGSAQTVQNVGNHAASVVAQTITRGSLSIDLSGKTVTADSCLEFQIYRASGNPNGIITIQNLRVYVGATDYGMPVIPREIGRTMASRRLQTLKTRTINGTTRVYFGKKRAVPTVTATVGTIANISEDSCDLTHSSAADSTLTIEAEFST